MRCLNCKENFIIKRRVDTLFKKEKYYICDKCFKKFPIKLSIDTIPITDRMIEIYSIFEKQYFINYDAFIIEYSKIFEYLYHKRKYFIIIFDYIKITENFIKQIEIFSTILAENVVILTFFQQN